MPKQAVFLSERIEILNLTESLIFNYRRWCLWGVSLGIEVGWVVSQIQWVCITNLHIRIV